MLELLFFVDLSRLPYRRPMKFVDWLAGELEAALLRESTALEILLWFIYMYMLAAVSLGIFFTERELSLEVDDSSKLLLFCLKVRRSNTVDNGFASPYVFLNYSLFSIRKGSGYVGCCISFLLYSLKHSKFLSWAFLVFLIPGSWSLKFPSLTSWMTPRMSLVVLFKAFLFKDSVD